MEPIAHIRPSTVFAVLLFLITVVLGHYLWFPYQIIGVLLAWYCVVNTTGDREIFIAVFLACCTGLLVGDIMWLVAQWSR